MLDTRQHVSENAEPLREVDSEIPRGFGLLQMVSELDIGGVSARTLDSQSKRHVKGRGL